MLLLVPQEVHWCQRLLAQIVRRAAVDMLLFRNHPDLKIRAIGQAAEEWLFVDNPDFSWTCESLNISESVVRAHILGMTELEARSLRGLEFDDELAIGL